VVSNEVLMLITSVNMKCVFKNTLPSCYLLFCQLNVRLVTSMYLLESPTTVSRVLQERMVWSTLMGLIVNLVQTASTQD